MCRWFDSGPRHHSPSPLPAPPQPKPCGLLKHNRRAAPDGSRWIGTAPDVIGEAQGVVAGNALNWTYTLDLATDSGRYNIAFDDWMFLIDERVMLNRAVMSFYGVRVGEVLISFRKLP